MSGRRGCLFAIARCFNSKPNDERILFEKKSTNTIEFENLVTAEQREDEARRSRQVVTEVERDYAMSGNFDQLVEEQRRIDAERDAELKRQEEALRQEQDAYYAAKREAAKRSRQSPQLNDPTDQSQVSFNFPTHFSTSLTPPTTTPTPPPAAPYSSLATNRTVKTGTGTHGLTSHPWQATTSFSATTTMAAASTATSDSGLSVKDKDDIDFDEFLENVKARQQSMTTAAPAVSSRGPGQEQLPALEKESDSEEEIDFGFWEKASPIPMGSDQLLGRTEGDLNLL